MPAGRHDFLCDQGEDWLRVVTWIDRDKKPIDAGPPAFMQVRGDADNVLVTITDSDTAGGFESGVAGVDFLADRGAIYLSIPQGLTRTFPDGTYFYDLFVTSRNKMHRLIAGHFNVRARRTLEYGETWP